MPMVNFELMSAIDKSHSRTDSLPAPNSQLPSPNKSPSVNPSMEELEEQFQCGVCYALMVLPTSLNSGHSFCRHCLAWWYDSSRRMECPACRQVEKMQHWLVWIHSNSAFSCTKPRLYNWLVLSKINQSHNLIKSIVMHANTCLCFFYCI